MERRQNFFRYFDDIDATGLRQRSLFLRYFEDFKAAGLDPVAVMDLAFSGASGVSLPRMVAGMELLRDRCKPPGEFFWALEDASPRTRDQIFNLLNWDDPKALAAELVKVVSQERAKEKKFGPAVRIRRIKQLVPALENRVRKFKADGETPKGILPFIPGETIAAVLSTYLLKRKREKRRGPLSFDAIAAAILLVLEGSDEDQAAHLRALKVALKARRRSRRNPRTKKIPTHPM